MDVLKIVNKHRRKITQRITKNLGSSMSNRIYDLNDLPEIKSILICRPNHRLGNLLLITPIVQEVSTTFPDCKIDLFVKGGLATIVFKGYKNIDAIIQLPKKPFKQLFKYIKTWFLLRNKHYDLVINVTDNSSSGRIATKFCNSTFKFFGDEYDDIALSKNNYYHIAKQPIHNFRRSLNDLGYIINEKETAGLDLKLSLLEIEQGRLNLNKLVTEKKETICIFTYATGNKCYSKSWWSDFYENLRTKYKNYNIVEVLPVENVSQIGFKAPSFYSKDIREIAALISNTKVFIGADSGIMHLASSSLTSTIGLFSVTDEKKYYPYNNGSIPINTNKKTSLDCLNELDKILLAN